MGVKESKISLVSIWGDHEAAKDILQTRYDMVYVYSPIQIKLIGLCLTRPIKGKIQVGLEIIDANHKYCVYNTSFMIYSFGYEKNIEYMLTKSVKLKPKVKYLIKITYEGSASYSYIESNDIREDKYGTTFARIYPNGNSHKYHHYAALYNQSNLNLITDLIISPPKSSSSKNLKEAIIQQLLQL